jgi:hypothetical protein
MMFCEQYKLWSFYLSNFPLCAPPPLLRPPHRRQRTFFEPPQFVFCPPIDAPSCCTQTHVSALSERQGKCLFCLVNNGRR